MLMISSALPGEGKTTLTACLARSAARSGERVIVVDCDSARRQFSTQYAHANEGKPGLMEVLAGDVTIATAIYEDTENGFHVLPMTRALGAGERGIDTVRMKALVAQLREHFHLILLDTAPLLPVAEGRELAIAAHSVVLVAAWRSTSDKAVSGAIELLPPVARRSVGVVLSKIDMKKQAHFARGDVGAFYSSYEGYYHA